MSTTERRPSRVYRLPILLLAITAIVMTLSLLDRLPGIFTAHDADIAEASAAQTIRTGPESTPASRVDTAPANRNVPHETTGLSRRESQASTPPASVDADIPPYESEPAEVRVEIGSPIDADSSAIEVSVGPQRVTSLGAILDADAPYVTSLENSSTEVITIGDDLPVDEEPR